MRVVILDRLRGAGRPVVEGRAQAEHARDVPDVVQVVDVVGAMPMAQASGAATDRTTQAGVAASAT
mgnify:CR=1 FL=1